MLLELLALICFAAFLLFFYLHKVCWSYWSKIGISTPPLANYLLGHLPYPFSKKSINFGVLIEKEYYDYFKKRNEPCFGVYIATTPIWVPIDLDLIKQVMIKDFDYFDQRGGHYDEERQPISAHLFNLGGKRWKNLRSKLTPTFTSGKMKLMFPSVVKCATTMMERLLKNAKNDGQKSLVDMKDLCGKYTTDAIGLCAFGIECNSFDNDNFHYYANKALSIDSKSAFQKVIVKFMPGLATALKFLPFPEDVAEFFQNITKETAKLRKKDNSGNKRNDFIQLLIELYEREVGGITKNEVLSSAFVFFVAGFETSATTLSYCLYQLALHQDIQDRVRQEILDSFNANGELTYQALGEFTYMQQVLEETLRMHPPVTVIPRECSKDYPIPGTKSVLSKGTQVFIPAKAIHFDPEYYPNPEKFDPERFSTENKNSRPNWAFLAFGEGPRLCIGSRFAYMQVKVGLASLLKEYRFTVSENTPDPLEYGPASILTPTESIILKCQRI